MFYNWYNVHIPVKKILKQVIRALWQIPSPRVLLLSDRESSAAANHANNTETWKTHKPVHRDWRGAGSLVRDDRWQTDKMSVRRQSKLTPEFLEHTNEYIYIYKTRMANIHRAVQILNTCFCWAKAHIEFSRRFICENSTISCVDNCDSPGTEPVDIKNGADKEFLVMASKYCQHDCKIQIVNIFSDPKLPVIEIKKVVPVNTIDRSSFM